MKNKFLLINKRMCLLLLLLIIFLLGVTAVSATSDNTTSVEVEDKIVKDTSSINDASLLNEVKTSDTKEVKDTTHTTSKNTVKSSDNSIKTKNTTITNKKYDKTIKSTKNDISTVNQKNTTTKLSTTKSLKTATTTDVKTFTELKNNVNTASGTTKTINLKSDIKLAGNLTLSGKGSALTINGNGFTVDGDDTYNFITVKSGNKLTLKNITIINCFTEDNGAVVRNYGTTTIQDSKFYYNVAGTLGGVIYNDATLTLNNDVFIANYGYFYGGVLFTRGTANLVNNNFTYNSASNDGGVIYSDSRYGITTVTTITNCIFNKNYANGRAVAIYNSDGTTKIYKSQFLNNNGTSTIENSNTQKDATLIVEKSIFNGTATNYIHQDGSDNDNSLKNIVKLTNDTFVGQKLSTKLSINVVKNYVNNTVIKVNGLNQFNSTINNGKVNIYVNNKLMATKTISNGQTTVTLKLQSGLQKITAIYSENNMYKKSTTTKAVQIGDTSSKLKKTTIQTQYIKTLTTNTTVKITVTALDKTKPTGKVSILTSSGKVLATKTLNNNGQATITVKLTAGNQKLTVKYFGNNIYNSSSTTKTITPIKESTSVYATIVKSTTTNTTLKITVKDSTKKLIKTGNIQILNTKGKVIKSSKLTNGIATIKLTPTVGTYKLTIKYQGNNTYKYSTITKTIKVTTDILYISPNGDDKKGIGTKNKPYKTLKKAIDTSKNGYTISLLGGTYTNKNIEKTITINKNIQIQNTPNNKVKITVNTTNELFKIYGNVNFTGINFEKSLDKLIINYGSSKVTQCQFISNTINNNYDGSVFGGNSSIVNYGKLYVIKSVFRNNSALRGEGFGGAITSNKGSLYIKDSIFNGNYGRFYGGAIYMENSKNTIINCTFKNQVSTYYGGAISVYGASLNLSKSYFYNNSVSRSGSAIHIVNNENQDKKGNTIVKTYAKVNIDKCTFDKNVVYDYGLGAGRPGGTIVTDGILTITNSNFKNNFIECGNGGVIINSGKLTIKSTNITNNKAFLTKPSYNYNDFVNGNSGGAIYSEDGSITISNTKINNNQAYMGGAIAIERGNVTIINSQLNNNKATYGGAIAIAYYPRNNKLLFTLNIKNTSMNNNYAEYSGAVLSTPDEIENNVGIINILNSQIKNNKVNTKNNQFGYIVGGVDTSIGKTTIKNSNITNNQASGTIISDINLEKCIIKNNKAKIIASYTGGYIIKSTFQNNTASKGVVYSSYGQYRGLTKLTETNFINNKGYLLVEGTTYHKMNIDNNYWGSSNPSWNKILKNVPKPKKYYKSKI